MRKDVPGPDQFERSSVGERDLHGECLVVVPGPDPEGHADLFQMGDAPDSLGPLLCALKRRQKRKENQNRDACHDHGQLDFCESFI